MRAVARGCVYFHALPSRFASTALRSLGSASTTIPGAITNSACRSGCDWRSSSSSVAANALKSTASAPELNSTHATQREECIDEFAHRRRRFAHPLEGIFALFVQAVGIVFQ